MDSMAWIETYYQGMPLNGPWTAEAENAVRACIAVYGRTRDEGRKAYVMKWAETQAQADTLGPETYCVLLFALTETGEEKYRAAFVKAMEALHTEGETIDPVMYFRQLTFRMAYEMKLNGMEQVGPVAAAFRNAEAMVDGVNVSAFLQALADAIAVCSDQLYEHWRSLVDQYRKFLPGALQSATLQEDPQLLHALLQGVQLGVIDPERYMPMAAKRLAALKQNGQQDAAMLMEMEFGVI